MTVGSLTEVVTKGTTPTSVGHKFTETGINFIKVESLNEHGQFIANKLAHISEDCHQALRRSQISEGDILFSIAGALGRTAVVPADIVPANTNQALSIIRLKNDAPICRPFLVYALSSGMLIEQIEKARGGVAQQNLSLAQVKSFTIPLPPLEEQQRIVAVLDEAFEGLARARAHAEANLQNARELFESFLGEVFQGGDWPTKTLNDISDNLDRVRVPITKADRKPGRIPYYGASGVVDHVADYLFDEDLLLVSEDGANLLARTYPIAFSISGKSWVNNHAHVLRFPDLDTQEYVRLYLNSITLEPFVSGMAQPKLNQAQLNRIPIPFPDPSERTEIVAKAELVAAETEDLQRRFAAALQDLDDLRQSLLHKAFAGELA